MAEQRRPGKYPAEMRERAVGMVREGEVAYGSEWEAICAVAEMLGPTAETVRTWVRRAEIDDGLRPGLTTDEGERLKKLERENWELRRANEILRSASLFLPSSTVDARHDLLHRQTPGQVRGRADLQGSAVRPVHLLVSQTPSPLGSQPAGRGAETRDPQSLRRELRGVWRSIWAQLNREDISVARCTVERLMRDLGIQGAVRGKPRRTTIPVDHPAARPADLVDRDFQVTAPNRLWVADITYVRTWSGFCYVCFITDAYSRRIVGWQASKSLKTDLTLDALEQAIWERNRTGEGDLDGLVHHSDRGTQYVSIRYTERLAENGVDASVGSRGDSYDNALAETIIGLYKTELVRNRGHGEDSTTSGGDDG